MLAIVGAVVAVLVVVAIAATSGDGGGGSADGTSTTSPPAGPTADTDFATVLYEDPPEAEPLDGFVLAGANRVAVEAVAQPPTVPDEQGQPLHPPPEHRFVAAKLAFEEASGGGPAAAGVGLELVGGDHRVDLTGVVTDDGLFYQGGWIAAVLPDGDEQPTLDVTYRGHTERLDLGTGERVDGSDLLYEPRSVDLAHEVADAEVPVTVPVPTPHAATVPMPNFTISRAELTAFEANRGWAPDGQAWLVVTVDGLYEPYLSDFEAPGQDATFRFAPWDSFTVAVGDDAVAPENAGPDPDGGMAVVFVVPDDLRSTTLHVAIRWILTVGGQEIEVTAPASDIPVTF